MDEYVHLLYWMLDFYFSSPYDLVAYRSNLTSILCEETLRPLCWNLSHFGTPLPPNGDNDVERQFAKDTGSAAILDVYAPDSHVHRRDVRDTIR